MKSWVARFLAFGWTAEIALFYNPVMWMMPILLAFSSPSSFDDTKRDALTRYGLARIAARSGQLATAEKQLAAAAKADPAAVAITRDRIRVLADLGRDAAALRLASDLQDRGVHDGDVERIIGRLHRDAKQYDAALQQLANALAHLPEERAGTKLAVLKELVATAMEAKDWVAGANVSGNLVRFLDENFNKLKTEYDTIEIHRERAWAFEKRGQCLVEMNKPAEAVTAFRAAAAVASEAAKDPAGVVRMHWNLAQAHAKAGDMPQALLSLEHYLHYKPKSVAPYQLFAEVLLKTKKLNDAEAHFQTVLKNHAEIDAVAWAHAAMISRDDPTRAHREFQALARTTRHQEFWTLLVATYTANRQAPALLQIADELFPPAPEVFPRKPPVVPPEVSDRQQAFAAALAAHPGIGPDLLEAARVRKDHSDELWELLGWLAERCDQPAELERVLVLVLAKNRGEPNATSFEKLARHYSVTRQWDKLLTHCNLGQGFEVYRAMLRSEAYAELGQRENAFAAVRSTAGFANFASQRQIIHLHAILGEFDTALKLCDSMLKEFTQDDAEIRKIRISRADAFNGLGRIDDMEAELRGLLDEDPDDPLVLNNLGYNLADQNRKLAEAEKFIRRAIAIDRHNRAKAGEPFPVSGVYLDSLGWVQFRRGDLKGARATLNEAVALPDGRPDAVVWDHLGDVSFRLDDKAAAKIAWQNAATRYRNDHRGKHQGRAEEVTRKLALCP